jgi:hypothetical protein
VTIASLVMASRQGGPGVSALVASIVFLLVALVSAS